MALWQLLLLATASATATIVLADNYGYGHPPPSSYSSSYAPHGKYEEYPSYDRDYSFNYGVKDDYTYNYQTRDEVKKGNTVYGSYSVVEPDGNLRVVNYEADDYGFRATVDREGVAPSYGAPAPYQASGPAYKAVPYVATASPAPYKATPVYAGYKSSHAAPYPGPYKAPAYKPRIYNQPLYKAPASYVQPAYKASIYANHRPPSSYSIYKAPLPYKSAGPTYVRGTYKAPTYNYDDEY